MRMSVTNIESLVTGIEAVGSDEHSTSRQRVNNEDKHFVAPSQARLLLRSQDGSQI